MGHPKSTYGTFGQFFTPPPPPVYATRTQWPWPLPLPSPPPLHARTQIDLIYTKYNKHNIKLVNRSPNLSFYADMHIFNYNIKVIKCKYLWWIFLKNAYVRSSLTPPPPSPVYTMRTHRPKPPPPPLRAHVLYGWPLTVIWNKVLESR